MSTCNQLDLQTLGSQPIMPKNLPDHCTTVATPTFYMMRLSMLDHYARIEGVDLL